MGKIVLSDKKIVARQSFLCCRGSGFLSFLGLSRFFRDFPELLGDGPGIFPICPFPLYRPIKIGHPQTRHETPTRHETTYFAESTPWPRPQRNLWCFAVFKAMNFNVPSIPDINPTRTNMKKHHKIRSKPNMKPQTQRETTASRSFIRLGPQIPPTMSTDTKHTRHETTSCLGRSSAATTVEIASQGCPCQVQQQCCFMWGLVS